MTKLSSLATATALASLLLMGAASAQSTAPAKTEAIKVEPAKTDPGKTEPARPGVRAAIPTPAEKKARSAISLECSRQADEKKLRGKERKKFRSECRKSASEKTT